MPAFTATPFVYDILSKEFFRYPIASKESRSPTTMIIAVFVPSERCILNFERSASNGFI
jgi:hypothetical protein